MTLKKVYIIFIILLSQNLFGQTAVDENMTLGLTKYKKKEYIDTIFYMNKVLDMKNELYSEALFWKAKSYFELKHYADAKQALELLFRTGSICAAYYEDGRFISCIVFCRRRDHEDARVLMQRSMGA